MKVHQQPKCARARAILCLACRLCALVLNCTRFCAEQCKSRNHMQIQSQSLICTSNTTCIPNISTIHNVDFPLFQCWKFFVAPRNTQDARRTAVCAIHVSIQHGRKVSWGVSWGVSWCHFCVLAFFIHSVSNNSAPSAPPPPPPPITSNYLQY